ncbi:MAG: hypothetical protein M2R45_00396 [Verrucomicrobia subdivision 3 bacterium]|nr:hypothetical protein [Limisphaerales bacterium]MCS1412845.1 hypothetical protein [Limisphaerales bacterium]
MKAPAPHSIRRPWLCAQPLQGLAYCGPTWDVLNTAASQAAAESPGNSLRSLKFVLMVSRTSTLSYWARWLVYSRQGEWFSDRIARRTLCDDLH